MFLSGNVSFKVSVNDTYTLEYLQSRKFGTLPIKKSDGTIDSRKVLARTHMFDLPKSSRAMIEYLCDKCGNKFYTQYRYQARKTENHCRGCVEWISDGLPLSPKDEIKAISQKYNEKKGDAKKRELDFELSKEHFMELMGQPCFYCGNREFLKIRRSGRKGERTNKRYKTRNGVDRIDSEFGYIVGNVAPACVRCNIAKNSDSVREFVLHIRAMYKHTEAWDVDDDMVFDIDPSDGIDMYSNGSTSRADAEAEKLVSELLGSAPGKTLKRNIIADKLRMLSKGELSICLDKMESLGKVEKKTARGGRGRPPIMITLTNGQAS